ncbi:MAG: hypothetical protein K9G11_02600 [Rickettsiaceae bacterium]|nr:hypothetical protein [Rickettsiaceae bacterium]
MKFKKHLKQFKNTDQKIPNDLINVKNLESLVQKSNKQAVKLILKNNADDLKNIDLKSLAEIALKNGDFGMVKVFVHEGVYPDLKKPELVEAVSKILNKTLDKGGKHHKGHHPKKVILTIKDLIENSPKNDEVNSDLSKIQDRVEDFLKNQDKHHHGKKHHKDHHHHGKKHHKGHHHGKKHHFNENDNQNDESLSQNDNVDNQNDSQFHDSFLSKNNESFSTLDTETNTEAMEAEALGNDGVIGN